MLCGFVRERERESSMLVKKKMKMKGYGFVLALVLIFSSVAAEIVPQDHESKGFPFLVSLFLVIFFTK